MLYNRGPRDTRRSLFIHSLKAIMELCVGIATGQLLCNCAQVTLILYSVGDLHMTRASRTVVG